MYVYICNIEIHTIDILKAHFTTYLYMKNIKHPPTFKIRKMSRNM